jgi:hypothetical protein
MPEKEGGIVEKCHISPEMWVFFPKSATSTGVAFPELGK